MHTEVGVRTGASCNGGDTLGQRPTTNGVTDLVVMVPVGLRYPCLWSSPPTSVRESLGGAIPAAIGKQGMSLSDRHSAVPMAQVQRPLGNPTLKKI